MLWIGLVAEKTHIRKGGWIATLGLLPKAMTTNGLRIRDVALIRMLKSRHNAQCAISFIRCQWLGFSQQLNNMSKLPSFEYKKMIFHNVKDNLFQTDRFGDKLIYKYEIFNSKFNHILN